jgi:hypothetical protein
MKRLRIRPGVAGLAVLASLLTVSSFIAPSSASAGLLDPVKSLVPTPLLSPITTVLSSPTPLPSVPIVDPLLNSLASPLPTVTGVPAVPLPGQLNDTIGGITGLLGGSTSPTPGTGSGSGSGSSHPTTGTSTGRTAGHGSGSGTKTSHTGVSGLTSLDGIGVITPAEAFEAPYATLSRQAVSKAAGRVLALAGPLAPPLMLAIAALAVLLMLSRGSTRLVKLDVAGLARRTWRI